MDKYIQKEIENEFEKIERKWLNIHFYISVTVVVLSCVLECFIGQLLFATGEIHITIPIYIIKFLLLPTLVNGICILIGYLVIQNNHKTQNFKKITISLLFVANCFIIFTVHGTFTALFVIFMFPILLTAIYGNYKLSVITAFASISALLISELLISWDGDKVNVLEDGIRLGNFLISVFVLFFSFVVSIVIIYFERKKNAAGLQKDMERFKLRQTVLMDELTGINNRIAFRNAIDEMERNSSESTYIFVMIDIDNFKQLNDNLGHVAGDNCLMEFADILKKNSSPTAIPFRYGGDEFSILFKNSALNEVIQICEQIQEDFRKNNTKIELPITASIGIAKYQYKTVPSKLITNADKALYQSKITKGRITVFEEIEDL